MKRSMMIAPGGGGGLPASAIMFIDPSDKSTMFLDAAATIPLTTVGQECGAIIDKINGVVFSQSTSNVRPRYEEDGFGGVGSLDYTGGETLATYNYPTGLDELFDANTDFTIIAVTNKTSAGSASNPIFSHVYYTYGFYLGVTSTGTQMQFDTNGAPYRAADYDTNGQRILSVTVDKTLSSSQLLVDGQPNGIAASITLPIYNDSRDILAIGKIVTSGASTWAFGGYIGPIVVLNSIDQADIDAAHAYLNSIYNIY